jgi:Protein of unknown function (DUF295)
MDGFFLSTENSFIVYSIHLQYNLSSHLCCYDSRKRCFPKNCSRPSYHMTQVRHMILRCCFYMVKVVLGWRFGDMVIVLGHAYHVGSLFQMLLFFKWNFYPALCRELAVIPDLGPNPTMRLVMPLFLYGIKYLVDFMGELLLVERHLRNIGDQPDWHFVTSRFEVHHLILENARSLQCKNIGDYTIFLGVICPLVVNSLFFQGCRKNSIYFTNVAL